MSGDGKVVAKGVRGTVKSFDPTSGTGLIQRGDNGEDCIAHRTAIAAKNPNHYDASLAEGEEVEFDVIQGDEGLEASNITGPRVATVVGDDQAGGDGGGRPLFQAATNVFAGARAYVTGGGGEGGEGGREAASAGPSEKDVNLEAIECDLSPNGFLTLEAPKLALPAPEVRQIPIGQKEKQPELEQKGEKMETETGARGLAPDKFPFVTTPGGEKMSKAPMPPKEWDAKQAEEKKREEEEAMAHKPSGFIVTLQTTRKKRNID